jgi:hypothetical protein
MRAPEGTLSFWSRLHLQSLALTNPQWARVMGYGPFSLCLPHKEGLCSSSGGINRLIMMMMMMKRLSLIFRDISVPTSCLTFEIATSYLLPPTLIPLSGVGTTCFSSCCDKD